MGWIKNNKMLFLSFISGIVIVIYLISEKMLEKISLVLIALGIIYLIKNYKQMNWIYLCNVLLGLVLGILVGGYSLIFFIEQDDFYESEKFDYEPADTAVLLVFQGEAERYNISIFTKNLYSQLRSAQKLLIPFKLYTYKRAYEDAGLSRYDELSEKIASKLAYKLDIGYDIYISYVKNKPYYTDVIHKEIFENKYKHLIVVPVSLTEDYMYQGIIQEVDLVGLLYEDTKIKIMSPLWNGEKFTKALGKELDKKAGDYNKHLVGIIFTAESKLCDKYSNQTKDFVNKIKKMLIEENFEERKVEGIFIERSDPQLESIVRTFQQYGVSKIVVVGINDIEDLIKEQYAMNKLIDKIKDDTEMNVEYIKGWGNNDGLIEELEYRIRALNVQGWDN